MDDERLKEAEARSAIAVRIRELLKQVVPENWIEAQLEVAACQADDRLCEIVGPIRNQDSLEEIHDLPVGILDAVEDYLLLNVSYNICCTRYIFRLGTYTTSSKKYIGVQYFYD
ncbi:MAG: hypothetical protein OSA84_12725 [Akkermansiaceae bacterium]|nr:hypothetical protein [Akkermansiaceae bacterium]